MLSAICFSLDQSKVLSSGNGLKHNDTCSVADNYDLNNVERRMKHYFVQSFIKTCILTGQKLSKMEKMVITSSLPEFCFFHHIFIYSLKTKHDLLGHLGYIRFVIC